MGVWSEEAAFLAEPATSRSDRPRTTWGSLLISVQTIPGRCEKPKCVKRADHAGECWPKG